MMNTTRNWSNDTTESQKEKIPVSKDLLVVSDLRSETKGSRFESGCQLCAEVSSLQ